MAEDIDSVERCAAILGVEATPEVRRAIERLLRDDPTVWALLDALAAHREPAAQAYAHLDERIEQRMHERWNDRVEMLLLRKRKKLDDQGRRLLAVLSSRVGEEVSLRELMLYNRFSAATDRRLRELKTEHGAFDIETIGSGRESSYRLVSTDPDIDRCAEYWLLNNIRESDLPVPERLLSLLKARMPEKVTIAEFRYVNPGRSAAGKGLARESQSSTDRRVRELREEGWQVYSHYDNAVLGLRAGEYVMLSLERVPPYERLKPEPWRQVMQSTDYRCTRCGWGRKDGPSQGRKLVEVHHKDPQNARPEDVNDLSNLIPLCNVCHDAE